MCWWRGLWVYTVWAILVWVPAFQQPFLPGYTYCVRACFLEKGGEGEGEGVDIVWLLADMHTAMHVFATLMLARIDC